MKHQHIFLDDYDWVVEVFYDTVSNDAAVILRMLRKLGCKDDDFERSRRMLLSGENNTGLTYSDAKKQESVMVIGRSSTLAEFLNSWQHEMTHLQRHICQAFWINPYSEEAAYLAGNLAQQMYPLLSQFMCDCNT